MSNFSDTKSKVSTEDKVAKLTQKQREVMQLVVERKSSKEIARILNIAKPTVDQRIASARQTLGAPNRDAAAILFQQGSKTNDRVIYDTACIPPHTDFPEHVQQQEQMLAPMMLNDSGIPASGIKEFQMDGHLNWLRSDPNLLSPARRAMIILGLTIGTLVMLLTALSVTQSLSDLLFAS
jgi:DNA-binding CsgD family transcriptional regulator